MWHKTIILASIFLAFDVHASWLEHLSDRAIIVKIATPTKEYFVVEKVLKENWKFFAKCYLDANRNKKIGRDISISIQFEIENSRRRYPRNVTVAANDSSRSEIGFCAVNSILGLSFPQDIPSISMVTFKLIYVSQYFDNYYSDMVKGLVSASKGIHSSRSSGCHLAPVVFGDVYAVSADSGNHLTNAFNVDIINLRTRRTVKARLGKKSRGYSASFMAEHSEKYEIEVYSSDRGTLRSTTTATAPDFQCGPNWFTVDVPISYY